MKFITKNEAKEILDIGLATGADFCEVFLENTVKNAISLSNNEIQSAQQSIIHGASIRILVGSEEKFGYVNDWSLDSLKELAAKLSAGIGTEAKTSAIEFVEKQSRKIVEPKKTPCCVSNDEKVSLVRKVNEVIRGYSEEISQCMTSITDTKQEILVANSTGNYVTDIRSNIRLSATAVAGVGANMQAVSDSIGANAGYEFLDDHNIEEFAKEVAIGAVNMAHAEEMVGGTMTVVVHNRFGGVLLHEACVHSLEATSVAKGASVFCNKLGQKIASDVVTAIDDGTRPNQWGSLNFDDEGNETQKNVLIENGILKSYLVDYRNSLIMNHPITGSSRRQSYQFSPTSRMTNTFFAPGNSTFDEIISNTKFGLFAKRMGGGSVNPSTGEFNFAVNEGYMIEDGKITKAVRGATLVGSGSQILLNIDMIGDNLGFGHGVCGSASGSVPTDVGQPTIRVQNITVGGRGSK